MDSTTEHSKTDGAGSAFRLSLVIEYPNEAAAPAIGRQECLGGTIVALQFSDALAEIEHLRDEREWLQFVVNFVRLPLGIAPDVSNFDREKILAALDAALSSPNAASETRRGQTPEPKDGQ